MDIATIAFWSVVVWLLAFVGIVAVFHRLVQDRKRREQSWEIRAGRRHSSERRLDSTPRKAS